MLKYNLGSLHEGLMFDHYFTSFVMRIPTYYASMDHKPCFTNVTCILIRLKVFLLILKKYASMQYAVHFHSERSHRRRTARSEVKSAGHTHTHTLHYVPLMFPKCCVTVLLCSLNTDAVWQTVSFSWPQTHTQNLFSVSLVRPVSYKGRRLCAGPCDICCPNNGCFPWQTLTLPREVSLCFSIQ